MNKPSKIIFLLSLSLLFSLLFGQNQTVNDTFYNQVKALLEDNQYQEVLSRSYPAMEKDREAKNWEAFSRDAYYASGALTGLHLDDSCIHFLEKALFTLREQHYQAHRVGSLYSYLGLIYVKVENYPAALTAYKEATGIFESLNEIGNSISYGYKNIAEIYLRRDDFPKTIFYLEAALRTDTSGEYRASCYSQLANCYYFLNDQKRVKEYCEKGFAEPGLPAIDKANLQSVAFSVYVREGKFDKAISTLSEALEVFPENPDYAIARIRTMTNLGTIYFNRGHIDKCNAMFQRAETEGKSYYKFKSREMAKLYVEWGDLYKKQSRNDIAIQYYQKALIQSWPGFNDMDIGKNPVGQQPPTELWAMNAASRKAAILITQKNVLKTERVNAADCFDLALAVAAKLRKVYEKDETKLYLQQNNYNIRVEAIKNLWEVYSGGEEGDKTSNLLRIFDLLESERAATLRDALVRHDALSQSGLPDSLRIQEESMRGDLAQLQSLLASAQNSGDSVKIKSNKDLIFPLQRKYDNLLFRMEKMYPKYVEYSHADDLIPSPVLQKELEDSSAIVSWFDSGDRYYCIALSGKDAAGFVVDKDSSVNNALSAYLQLLTNPEKQSLAPDYYFTTSRKVCQFFLPETILARYKYITIIPDGLLCYVPFEALVTKEYSGKYANAPYVLSSHTIRYNWAASLLNDNRETKPSGKMFFMAPFARLSKGNLPQLPDSKEECPENISSGSLVDTSGSTATFLQFAGEYDIIHLATHAHTDESGESKIEFADRAISADEIYNYHFNASLVSLSACETGVGRYFTGEGVISLARAFAYAGAQSLVASLWQVNDRSTSSIFKSFYKELSNGKSKSASLRQAKLAYLHGNISESAKTPWHWAGFTLMGNDDSVEFPGSWLTTGFWKIIIGCTLVSLLFFGLKKRFFNAKNNHR